MPQAAKTRYNITHDSFALLPLYKTERINLYKSVTLATVLRKQLFKLFLSQFFVGFT